MTSPNSTFTELVTTTLREHPGVIFDNVTKNNALLNRIMKRQGKDILDGGYEIVEPLEYAENSTYQRYAGYDTLNVQASDVLTAAKFDWKNAVVQVTCAGDEIRKNSGSKTQIKNLAKARIKNAMNTFSNSFSSDLYSAGTETNQINGLQALVSDLGTGTVGGINSSTYTFWKSILQSAAAPLNSVAAVTPGPTTMESLMLPLYMELTRGQDMPDLVVSSNEYFAYYEAGLTQYKRYTDDAEAQGGFISLKYKGADVIFDGGTKGGGIPAAHMYMLNTKYLRLKVHKDANMTQMDDKISINQDAVVIPILLMANLTVSNRSLQGLIKA